MVIVEMRASIVRIVPLFGMVLRLYPRLIMKNTLTAFLLALASFAPLAHAGEISPEPPPARVPVPLSWKLSIAPLVASQALDITSSYGMRELNPLLAQSRGQFGAESATIKLGVTGGLIGVEYLIIKAHPSAARLFTKLNWGAAALTTGFAAHNFAIK
jgi:hypothetical protein